MPRHRRPSSAVVVALLSLSAALPVLAQEATEGPAPTSPEEITVSLQLTGPEGCGSESDLASRIAWRTSRVRVVPVGESERRIEVTLDVAGNAATATLLLTLPNGRRATRVLRAATCDEAVDAAALVAAVTLDPTASTALTKPGADAGATGGTGTGGTAPRPDASAVPPSEGGTGGSSGNGESRSELSGGPFVAGEVVTGPAPSALYGLGAGFMGVWNRGSVLSPALRLSGVYFPGKKYEQIDGTAYFSLYAGALDVCPLRFGSDTVALFGCGTFIAGVLNAEGRQTNSRQDNHRPWLVLGGTALLEIRPVAPLELELFGTFGSPLLRDTFQFDCAEGAAGCEPDVFHVVSSLSVQAGVAVGVFFR